MHQRIPTALDALRSSLDAQERAVVENVERHGFHIALVQGAAADDEAQPEWRNVPDWTFSVGLYVSYQHPEVVIFGLPRETGTAILWDIATEAQGGAQFEPGRVYDGSLPSFPGQRFAFEQVAPELSESLFGWARWFYGSAFEVPILQYLWPDQSGLFAWDTGVDDHEAQRQLADPPLTANQPPRARC